MFINKKINQLKVLNYIDYAQMNYYTQYNLNMVVDECFFEY